jgi:hypothetical protein
MAMAGLYDGIEETTFKRIAGGYVFQSRNPWFFGPSHRYLVDEAQKAEIAGCIRETLKRIKPYVFAAAVIIPIMIAAGAFWLVTHGCATVGNIVLLALAPFIPYIGLMHAYSMRRLRPLIAGLPRTNERITVCEGTSKFAVKASFKILLLMLLGPVLLIIANAMIVIGVTLDGRSLHNPHMMLFSTAMCALSAAYTSYLMILRMREKRTAA